jgi:hypothetical protein
MISIIGENQTVSNIDFRHTEDSVGIFIKKAGLLITIDYNLYLPSQTQVVEVSPLEALVNIKNDIMHRKVIPNPVKLGSHCRTFRITDKNCGFHESKTCQLKNVKAGASKRTTLADRMTGKGNKFSCYVSAFANHSGGNIYYGITDNAIVEGEFIPSEKDKEEITKKVEKSINKMIWPEQIGEPKRGEHWEIFFEPVVDENSKPVPSTFVIVIYIAPCLGGVFTEEPECHEIVDGKVKKMSFTAWEKGILQPVWLRGKEEIPQSAAAVTWSSPEVQKVFAVDCEKLRRLISNGDWDAISKECQTLLKKSELPAMKLVVLSKQVIASNRRGNFRHARFLLEQYMDILWQVEDILIFEMIFWYLKAALARASRDFKAVKECLTEALSKAELVKPGLATAIVYVFASTVTDLVNLEETSMDFSPDNLSVMALQHLQCVQDPSDVLTDMKRKAHITLATFYLGCNISGQPLKTNIENSNLEKASTSITAIFESLPIGNPLKSYHDVQFNLVLSINNYRHSQARNRSEATYFLRHAFNYAKKAECLARQHQFKEMVEWSKANKALCTEELVRVKLIELELRFLEH